MSTESRKIDSGEDLLHDLKKIDAGRKYGVPFPTDRSTASLMREVGFSDAEIIERLGYLPDAEGISTPEPEAATEPRR
jgi:hypothetical protein